MVSRTAPLAVQSSPGFMTGSQDGSTQAGTRHNRGSCRLTLQTQTKMLRSLYVMLDYHVAATDGEMGRVRDFLFDDETWMVHHLLVESGTQGDSAKVLIAPAAVWFAEWESKCLNVLLSRDEVWQSARVE